MRLSPGVRRAALTAHVSSSVGWFGAVAVFLVLAVAGLRSRDDHTVRAAYVAMDLSARYAIVPLAFASILTGLLSSLGTQWGLLRHYWVLIKFLLVVVATVILLLQLTPIGHLAATVTRTGLSSGQFSEARLSPIVHAIGGLAVLLTATVLAVFKPRGMTGYGRRRQERTSGID
ncbi:hypothetical protein EDD30_3739 [Couchioplanes caeruleus]|uniref:DUF2269 domain-containing protein n=3 Tax=Couchioplanes caeruleus TaxID=56438 RepID=A0A1K0FEL6_9ACTN|nr:hypothetical protein BG844_28175 [Couchioplanes caeruleus subsp. caeruleus]ROP30873.1 hypothetical protein EDD30_3739 [Couchioplanes caeruleus]